MREQKIILQSAIATATMIITSLVVKPVWGATLYINTNALSMIFQEIIKSSVDTSVTESSTGVEVKIRPGNNRNSSARRNDHGNIPNSMANIARNFASPSSPVFQYSFPLSQGINHQSEISYGRNYQIPWMIFTLRGGVLSMNGSRVNITSPVLRRYLNSVNIGNNLANRNTISSFFNGQNFSVNNRQSPFTRENFSSNNSNRESSSVQENIFSSGEENLRKKLENTLTQGDSFLTNEESPLENPFSEENNWEEDLGELNLATLGLGSDNEPVLSMASLNNPNSVQIPEANSLMGLLVVAGGLFFGKKIERASD